MTVEIAFVGDIHGNLSALEGIFEAIGTQRVRHTIFLGDYINKGPQSAAVMRKLISYSRVGCVTLLRGNHEEALLDALDAGNLATFLKMGGAKTIRSYVGTKVGPDVLNDFRINFPTEHLDAIRRMPPAYESDDFIAQHIPLAMATPKFRISSHLPVGELPRIGHRSAHLDTGCGAGPGRLTALLWPSLNYLQVDAQGSVITRPHG